jgi:ribosomal protein S3
VVIGRKGAELDKIKATLNKKVGKEIMLDIQEVKAPRSYLRNSSLKM